MLTCMWRFTKFPSRSTATKSCLAAGLYPDVVCDSCWWACCLNSAGMVVAKWWCGELELGPSEVDNVFLFSQPPSYLTHWSPGSRQSLDRNGISRIFTWRNFLLRCSLWYLLCITGPPFWWTGSSEQASSIWLRMWYFLIPLHALSLLCFVENMLFCVVVASATSTQAPPPLSTYINKEEVYPKMSHFGLEKAYLKLSSYLLINSFRNLILNNASHNKNINWFPLSLSMNL